MSCVFARGYTRSGGGGGGHTIAKLDPPSCSSANVANVTARF